MTSSVQSFNSANQISRHNTSDVRTNYNIDHLFHMFHHGQVYFMILTVRFILSLCYCGTPYTHDFLSFLFPFLYLFILYLFQIFIKSTSSSFLHLLHHIFFLVIFFIISSSTYSSSS